MNAANNRLVVMLAGAIVAPWLDQRFGIQLTPVDTAAILVLGYHCAAAVWGKGVCAFLMYFPPKNPPQPVAPAKVPA